MVKSVTLTRVLLVLTVSLGILPVFAGPAGATGVPAAGVVTCSYGTTMTFSPPLKQGKGHLAAPGSNEVMTIAPAALGNCTGSVTAGTLPTSGAGTQPISLVIPPTVVNGVRYIGGCDSFRNFVLKVNQPTRNFKYAWSPSGDQATKAFVTSTPLAENPTNTNFGYTFTGTAQGSFAGTVTISAWFDSSSSTAIGNCVSGIPGLGSKVSSATVDSSLSTITLPTPVP